MITIERIPYKGWENNIRITNGTVEVIVTLQVGPRIIRLGLVGERNLFRVLEEECGIKGGSRWYIFGGHRLWHAPEANPRSYCPDNDSVRYTPTEKGVFSLRK